MDLFLTILGHCLTFIGALVAVIGNTWNIEAKGIAKLSGTGRLATVIAIVGIFLSIYQSVEDHKTKSVYRNIALNDIRGGWRRVATPLLLIAWEVTGKKSDISIGSIQKILDQNLLAKFDKVNFTQKSKVPQYGPMSLGLIACKQSSVGMKIMEEAVQNNTSVVSRDIAKKIKELRRSPVFGKLLAAGCGTTIGKKDDFSLFAGMFDTHETKNYIEQLVSLGKLLGDPGIKRQ
jgi:hypothetical protein